MIPRTTPAGTAIVHRTTGGPTTAGLTASEPAQNADRLWTVHVDLEDGRHVHCILEHVDLAQLELFG